MCIRDRDWKGRQIIGGIIRSLSERGKLVIAILHDMDFVAENFERVIIMACLLYTSHCRRGGQGHLKRQENRAVIAWRRAARAGLVSSADRAYICLLYTS